MITKAADVSRERAKEVAKWFGRGVLDELLNRYVFNSENEIFQHYYTNFDSVILAILQAMGYVATYPTNVPQNGKIWYWLESFSKDV